MITDFYRSIPVMQGGKITGAAEHREYVCDESDVANLPGADVCLPGSIAWDVTTGTYYAFNGLGWVEIRGGGGGSASKLTVTPEMFGAKGDGVTDDTEAVQAAIDHALPVTFMHDYLVSTLSVGSNKVIDGNGHTITRLKDSGDINVFFHIDNASNVLVRNLGVNANYDWYDRITENEEYQASKAVAKECVSITGSHDVVLDNISASYGLTGFTISGGSYHVTLTRSQSSWMIGDGVHMGSCHHCTVTDHYDYKCEDDAYSANTYVNSTYQPYDNTYSNCKAVDCYGRGFNTSGKRIIFKGGQCIRGNMAPINFETRVSVPAEDCIVSD